MNKRDPFKNFRKEIELNKARNCDLAKQLEDAMSLIEDLEDSINQHEEEVRRLRTEKDALREDTTRLHEALKGSRNVVLEMSSLVATLTRLIRGTRHDLLITIE